jgi:hypothetical protein
MFEPICVKAGFEPALSQEEVSHYTFTDKRVANRFAFVMQRLLPAAAISLPAVFTQKAA